MSTHQRPLHADVCTLACRLRSLAVDGVIVALAAVASALVSGWLAEAVVWFVLGFCLTWRRR